MTCWTPLFVAARCSFALVLKSRLLDGSRHQCIQYSQALLFCKGGLIIEGLHGENGEDGRPGETGGPEGQERQTYYPIVLGY